MGFVLVVDDEQLIAETLVEVLAWEGYEVQTASNGADALERIERELPDLLLIDFMMPIKDGITALRELRSRWPAQHVPTILMTAAPYAVPRDEELFDTLLTKPFTVKMLRDAIAMARAARTR